MNISGLLIELFKLLAAGLVTLEFHKYGFIFQTTDISTLAGVLSGCAATILGFLITAIALMASVMDRSLLRNLRSTGGYSKLVFGSFVCAGLHLLLLTASLSLLLPWSGDKHPILLITVFIAALAWLNLVSTGAGLYRVIIAISRSSS